MKQHFFFEATVTMACMEQGDICNTQHATGSTQQQTCEWMMV